MDIHEIGSFEAKTKFAELLRQVQDGRTVIITLRGRPVAQIATPDPAALRQLEDQRHAAALAALPEPRPNSQP